MKDFRRKQGLPNLISLLAVVGIITLSLAPRELRAVLRTPLPAAFEHALAYAAVGFVMAASLRIGAWRSGLILIPGLIVLAGLLEIAQLSVPGRNFRIGDIVGSGSGAATGVCLALALGRIIARLCAGRWLPNGQTRDM